ncbi:MAG: 3-methyl-2-oxobutanoate dehydrogenase subunit beta [Cyanobacteriota bacterium]
MKKKVFFNGSKAVAEGSIYAGCRYYYSTPKPINNEIIEYMSYRMPEVNGVFVQSENEKSVIGMVIGSSVAGQRVMTSSTTEGISSMLEGINYMSAMELPSVVISIMYGRNGIINYEQGQYGYADFIKSSSHINNKFIVFAPYSAQSAYDLTIKASELADKYRNPVVILLDVYLAVKGECIEIFQELLHPDSIDEKDWKLNGAKNREPLIYKNFYGEDLTKYKAIMKKIKLMETEEIYEEFHTEDAEELVVAFGSFSENIKGYINELREKGRKIGLFVPVSLSPFPRNRLIELAEKVKKITVTEVNTGFMYSDIINIVRYKTELDFIGETEDIVGFREVLKEFAKRYEI